MHYLSPVSDSDCIALRVFSALLMTVTSSELFCHYGRGWHKQS